MSSSESRSSITGKSLLREWALKFADSTEAEAFISAPTDSASLARSNAERFAVPLLIMSATSDAAPCLPC